MINYLLIGLFKLVRPILGPAACKYPLSCGNFAVMQLKERPLVPALWSIIKRIGSCNPFSKTYIDD